MKRLYGMQKVLFIILLAIIQIHGSSSSNIHNRLTFLNDIDPIQKNISKFPTIKYPNFKVKLLSNGSSKVIPLMKQCSCQLVVFMFHYGQYDLYIGNIHPSVNLVQVNFIKMNKTYKVCPKNQQIIIKVETNDYRTDRFQITEYFQIIAKIQDSQALTQTLYQQTRKVYLIRCEQKDQFITLPKNSIILTQILAFILILVLPLNIKYRRFTPLNFGIGFAILYSVLLFITMYVDGFLQKQLNQDDYSLDVARYIISVQALIALFIYTNDIVNMFLQKRIVIILLSLVFSILVIITDLFILPEYWYINNIIAIFVSGCMIKFIVIRKLKASVIPLSILWGFCIVRQFAYQFRLQSIQQSISLQIFPLFLQIPAVFNDDKDGYICSAFGSSKIVVIGLIVNYAKRIDLFISSRFYYISMTLLAFFCLSIQLSLSFFFDQIPVMEFFSVTLFLPMSLLILLLCASKRGQWAIVWHGSFYDMAVNRVSIRKSQDQDLNSLQQKFGEGLKLNSSSVIYSK